MHSREIMTRHQLLLIGHFYLCTTITSCAESTSPLSEQWCCIVAFFPVWMCLGATSKKINKKKSSFVPIKSLGDRVLLRDQTGWWSLMSNVAVNCVCTFAHVSFQQLHCSETPRESEWSSFYSVKRIKTQHNTHNFYAVKSGTAGLGPLEAQFYLFGFTGFLPSSGLQEKVHMSLGSNNQTRDKYLHV